MEEGAIAALRASMRLVLPIGVIGIATGLFSAVAGARVAIPSGNGDDAVASRPSSAIEQIAVGICTAVCVLGFVVAIQTIRSSRTSSPRFPLLPILFSVGLILTGLPAALWKTRFRWIAEGVALTALSGSAILGAWSIGVFFLPLIALMLWVCLAFCATVFSTGFTRHRRVDSPL